MAFPKFIKFAIVGLLIAVAGWALFDLAKTGLISLVSKMGISNGITVNIIIIVLIVIILTILKVSWKKIFKG